MLYYIYCTLGRNAHSYDMKFNCKFNLCARAFAGLAVRYQENIMVQLQNRKMPSTSTAWFYIALSSLLAMLSGVQPITGLILMPLAIALGATGILSIPRLPYYQAVLLSILIGIVPAGGIYLLFKLFSVSLAVLAITPAIALFVLTVRLHQSRSSAIRWITAFLTVFYTGAALLLIWELKGGLTVSVFKSLYNDAKDWFMQGFADLPAQYTELLQQGGFTEDLLPELFNTTLAIIPGLAIALLWGMAWFATVCLRWIFSHYVYGADRFAKWPVTMTKFGAWVFIICFILQALPLTGKWMLIPIIACNFYYLLTPGFFVVGCRVIKERILHARGCGCFPFVIIGSAFTMPAIVFMFLAMTGAFRTISPASIIPFVPTVPPSDPNSPQDPENPNYPQNPQNPQNPDDQGGSPQA